MLKLFHVFLAITLFLSFSANAEEKRGSIILLEDVDLNGDGAVSPDEVKAYIDKLNADYELELDKQRLKAIQEKQLRKAKALSPPAALDPADTNKDGIVSPEERAAYMASLKPEPDDNLPKNQPKEMVLEDVPEFLEKKYQKRLKEMAPHDANKDGILQAEELAKKTELDFGITDTNNDGILSPDEMAAFRKKVKTESLKAYDSKSQANQDSMKFKNYYQQADKNDDNVVSKEEYETYFKNRYKKFDRDGDGIVSQGEYRSDFEKLPRTYKRKKEEEEED